MAASRALNAAGTPAAGQQLLWRLQWLILPAICLLPILLYLPFLLEPLERDEGVYATIAQGLLRGQLPYRDLFDHKPPLIYVWYVASFSLFGQTILAPRLMAALAWSATTLLVYKQVELIDSRGRGLAAATVFAASSGLVLLQANANTEVFMLLPVVLCLFAGTRAVSTPGAGWLFLTGLAGALAIMTKEVATPSVGVVVVAAVIGTTPSWRSALGRAAVIFAGMALVFAIVILPFLLSGALADFVYANWTFNRLYGAELSLGERIRAEIHGLVVLGFSSGVLLALAAIGAWRQRATLRRLHFWLMLAWLGAAYGGVLASGHAYPHYYVALLPGLALFAGPGLLSLTSDRPGNRLILPVVTLAMVVATATNGSVFLEPTPAERHLAKYEGVDPKLQIASPELGAFVASITSPQDEIYNLGFETELYFYANRKPATPFIYNAPFLLDARTFDKTIADLERDPPAVIVDSSMAKDLQAREQHPTRLQALLAERYVYLGLLLYADVYRLKRVP